MQSVYGAHVVLPGEQRGAAAERAAIVKYLRDWRDRYESAIGRSPENTEGRVLLGLIVESIERGTHHK